MGQGLEGARVVQLAVGLTHALALLDNGAVASVGQGVHGVLGHGNTLSQTKFTRIVALRDRAVDSVSVGEAFSAVQDVQGQVWVWGCDDAGELGMEGKGSDRFAPLPLGGLSSAQIPMSMASNRSGALERVG
jgi:alpha-tubulin suppressor-like RCC1 family protein